MENRQPRIETVVYGASGCIVVDDYHRYRDAESDNRGCLTIKAGHHEIVFHGLTETDLFDLMEALKSAYEEATAPTDA